MMPARKGEGLLVGVAVVGSVTVLEDTDVLMVPPAVVVMVGITAVIDEREAVDMMKRTLYTVLCSIGYTILAAVVVVMRIDC